MNTRLLMSSSALFMAVLGVVGSFLPQESVAHFGARPDPPVVLLIQIAGALYLGFAILNGMAKGVLIGGVYSRPLALGNFLHFAVSAIILLKALLGGFKPIEHRWRHGLFSIRRMVWISHLHASNSFYVRSSFMRLLHAWQHVKSR